jgi:hypothetical protein
MNVVGLDANSYFNWNVMGVSAQDGLDAATGASKAKSTLWFDQAVTYDILENAAKYTRYTLPSGLRGLFLYPVALDGVHFNDNLAVTANDKQVVIRYVRRDSADEIATDVNGNLDGTTRCKLARGDDATEDQRVFILKPEFSKTGQVSGDTKDFDCSKAARTPDVFGANTARHYTGDLDVAFENNCLTIKGSLKEVK